MFFRGKQVGFQNKTSMYLSLFVNIKENIKGAKFYQLHKMQVKIT